MINIFLMIAGLSFLAIILSATWERRDLDQSTRRAIRMGRGRAARENRPQVCANAYGEVYFVSSGIAEVSPLIRDLAQEQIVDRDSAPIPLLLTWQEAERPPTGRAASRDELSDDGERRTA